jgi:hypothetical protein
MSASEHHRRVGRISTTSASELAGYCRATAEVINENNFMHDQLSLQASVFSDGVTARSIDGWLYKIIYDSLTGKQRRSPHFAYSIGETIDLFIKDFAQRDSAKNIIESLLKRPLKVDDTPRLLWVGDHGYKFAKQFLLHFATYLEKFFGSSSLPVKQIDDGD